MVECIKEFSTELQAHLLSDRYILEQAQIEVEQSRISESISSETAEVPRIDAECAVVDVFCDLFRSRPAPTKGRITDEVGSIGTCSGEGCVDSRINSVGRPGLCRNNAGHLPISKKAAHYT